MASWGYGEDNGPSNWHRYCPIASTGKRQSPIDIIDKDVKSDSNLKPFNVFYPPFSKATILNNGHSVQFQPDASGNSSELTGGPLSKKYKFEQFHFHWGEKDSEGSEHRVNGKMYPAELHLVHWNCESHGSFKDAVGSGDPNGLCVLGFFLKVGAENAGLKPFIDLLPKVKAAGSSLPIPEEFDLKAAVPKALFGYYTYDGSLTTPPLAECVKWIVFKEPVEVSAAQMAAFRALDNKQGQPLISLQRLAAQVCGLFIEIEGKNFERRLATVLLIIANTIKPEQFEMEKPAEDAEHLDDSRIAHRIKDHLLFNTLSLLAKVIKECQVIKKPSRQQDMAPIWESVEAHMLHPHTWVRLVSSRLLGLLFAAWKPEELVTGFQKGNVSIAYLQEDLPGKVTKLCGDIYMQLRSPLLDNELGEQIVKNLVFLAKTLQILLSENISRAANGQDKSATREETVAGEEFLFTLKDLLSNMNKLATLEASQTPKHTQKRSCVLRWLAAVSINLGKDVIEPYLEDVLSPVHREFELASTYKDSDLNALAQEVLDLIKGLVGRETFSRAYASLQQTAAVKRETRKRKEALEAVADPAKSARKKLKKNLAKEEPRKRKLDSRKPERKLKAPRMERK